MKYIEYFICDKNGKSNCVIRSLCKVYNMEYDDVYNELCDITHKLNCESFNDVLVFETFMKEHDTLPIECKDIKIKDLELDNGNYLVFCWDKKDFYHMVPIMDNTIYDRDNSSLDLYVITLYKQNKKDNMLLRTYKEEDAEKILHWIKNEREFRLWSADRYDSYPATPNDINRNYSKSKEISNFYPMTLEEDGKVIGHLILRNPSEDKEVIRMGFIIVDNSIRGKGYGKALINAAIKYAKETLGAKEINLGVFINNDGALHCYESVGFKITEIEKNAYQFYDEEWDCAEMILK